MDLRGGGSLLNRYVRDSAFAAKLLSVIQRMIRMYRKICSWFCLLRAIGLTVVAKPGELFFNWLLIFTGFRRQRDGDLGDVQGICSLVHRHLPREISRSQRNSGQNSSK